MSMNVGELKAKLKEFSDDLLVVIDGYEGGVGCLDPDDNFYIAGIKLNVNDAWFLGEHELCKPSAGDCQALYISR